MQNKKNVKYIEDRDLAQLIKEIFEDMCEDKNMLKKSKTDISSSLYDNTLEKLKEKSWYYKNLTDAKLQSIRKEVEKKYTYPEESEETLIEEYDRMVWDKVNGEYFDENRFKFLKNRLGING